MEKDSSYLFSNSSSCMILLVLPAADCLGPRSTLTQFAPLQPDSVETFFCLLVVHSLTFLTS